MSKNREQFDFNFGLLETFTKDTTVPENLTDMVVKASSDECNAAITQVYIDSERVEDTKEESVQEYTPEQTLDRRQELLQNRKRFVQTVLDAIYVNYQTQIDNLIANNQKWHKRIDEFDKDKAVIATWWIQNRIDSIKPEVKVSTDRRNELYKRWGTARFIKQIVRDDEKLKDLLKIKVDIAGSKKAKKQSIAA